MIAPLVRFVALGALLSTFTVACAATPAPTGSSEDDVAGADDGNGDDANADDPATSKEGKEPASSSTPTPAPTTASPPTTATPATETPNNRTCQTAKDIGELAGDDGTGTVNATGACSDWLKVRVKESSSSILADEMKITVTLRSPTAADDFDLVVHMNHDKDQVECTAVTGKSEKTGAEADVVKTSWGEQDYTGNRDDDSRTVIVEVKKKTPGCSATPWTLQIQGNF